MPCRSSDPDAGRSPLLALTVTGSHRCATHSGSWRGFLAAALSTRRGPASITHCNPFEALQSRRKQPMRTRRWGGGIVAAVLAAAATLAATPATPAQAAVACDV